MAAKKKMSNFDKVAKRFGITAREVRDIATAVSTAAMNVKTGASKSFDTRDVQNIKRQVKEVGRAARTGKKGTVSNLSINAFPESKKEAKKYKPKAARYKNAAEFTGRKSPDAFIMKGKKRK